MDDDGRTGTFPSMRRSFSLLALFRRLRVSELEFIWKEKRQTCASIRKRRSLSSSSFGIKEAGLLKRKQNADEQMVIRISNFLLKYGAHLESH